jgi:hypothetical protein
VLVFGLGSRPHWLIRADALAPLVLTVLDALGYGLLMTALTLRVSLYPVTRTCAITP